MQTSTSMRLERNIERIMNEWEKRACSEIKSASTEGTLALRNSLPEYLSQLSSALCKKIDRTEARKNFDKAESTRVGKKHGKERSENISYTMDELIFEYHILRQVICDVLEEEMPLSGVEREIIVCSIEQAVNDAATEFSTSLNNLNSLLNEEKNLRDKFVASLSHDLRTPLTSIRMIAQMMAKKIQEPEEILKASNKIVTGVDRIDTMIQDLLDFTHFRVGEEFPFHPEVCSINKIVKVTIDELSVINGKRFEVKASDQIEVLCDPSAITRILENLATNAIKYGDKSSPITLRIEKHDGFVDLSIHNRGNPIDPKDLDTIFEPYKRTESAEQGSQQGWGIGLPLIKGLAEAHGGHAKVKSSSDGTTFTVSIPM